MLESITVNIQDPNARIDESVYFSLSCSLDEAFTLLSMPAFAGRVVSLFPEYTDDLPTVLTEEKE